MTELIARKQWNFDTTRFNVPFSAAMVELVQWASLHEFGGQLMINRAPHNWCVPLDRRGPQGPQGPQGFLGCGYPEPNDEKPLIPLDKLVLAIKFKTIINYSEPHPSGKPWIPNVYDTVNLKDSIGSIKSVPIYTRPSLSSCEPAPLLVGLVQPRRPVWQKWQQIEDDTSLSVDDFFMLDGQYMDSFVTVGMEIDQSLPVFGAKTEPTTFSGFYDTTIECLASELENIHHALKAIMWVACKPKPGACFQVV